MTQQLAGMQSGRVVTTRKVLRNTDTKILIDGVMASSAYDGGQASGYESYIRGGWILGQDSTTKRWSLCKQTRANGAGVTTATLIVDNAAAFKAGDNITVNGVAKTIQSINYSTNTITLTATASWSDRDSVLGTGGVQIARGILLNDEVELYNYEKRTLVEKAITIVALGEVFDASLLGDKATVFAAATNANSTLFHRIIRDAEFL